MANNEYLLGAGVKDDKWTPIVKNKNNDSMLMANITPLKTPKYKEVEDQQYTPSYNWVKVGTEEENAIKALDSSTSSVNTEELGEAAKNTQFYNDSAPLDNVMALFSDKKAKEAMARKRGYTKNLVDRLNKAGVSVHYNMATDVITYKDKDGLTHEVDASTSFLDGIWASKMEILGAIGGSILGGIAGGGGGALTGGVGVAPGVVGVGIAGSAIGAGLGNIVDQKINHYNTGLDITTNDGKKKAISLAVKKTLNEELASAIDAMYMDIGGSVVAGIAGKGISKFAQTEAGKATSKAVKAVGSKIAKEAKELGADVMSTSGIGKNIASTVTGGLVGIFDPVLGVTTAIGTRAALHKNIISMGTLKGIGAGATTGFFVDPTVGAIVGTLVKLSSRNADYMAKVYSEAQKLGGKSVNDLANAVKNAGIDGARVTTDIEAAMKLDAVNGPKINDTIKTAFKNAEGQFTDMDVAMYDEMSKLINNSMDIAKPAKQVTSMILSSTIGGRLMKGLAKNNAEKAGHLQVTLGYMDDFIRTLKGRPLTYTETVQAASSLTKSVTENAKAIFDGLASNDEYKDIMLKNTFSHILASNKPFFKALNAFYSAKGVTSSRLSSMEANANAFNYAAKKGIGEFERVKYTSNKLNTEQNNKIDAAVHNSRKKRTSGSIDNDNISLNEILTAVYDASFSTHNSANELLKQANKMLGNITKGLGEQKQLAFLSQVHNVSKALKSMAPFKGSDFYSKLTKLETKPDEVSNTILSMMKSEVNGSTLLPMYLNALKAATSNVGGNKEAMEKLIASAEWIAIDNAINAFTKDNTPSFINFNALLHNIKELPLYSTEAKAFRNMVEYLAELLPNKTMLQKTNILADSGIAGARGSGIGYSIINRFRTLLTTSGLKKILGFVSSSPEATIDRLSKQLASTIANPDEVVVRNNLNEVFETMKRRLANEEVSAFNQARSEFNDVVKDTIINPNVVADVAPSMPKADFTDIKTMVGGIIETLGEKADINAIAKAANASMELSKKANIDVNEELLTNMLANKYNVDVATITDAIGKVKGTDEMAIDVATKEQQLANYEMAKADVEELANTYNTKEQPVVQTVEELAAEKYSEALYRDVATNIKDVSNLDGKLVLEYATSTTDKLSKEYGTPKYQVYNDIKQMLFTKAESFGAKKVKLPDTYSDAVDELKAINNDSKVADTKNYGEQATKNVDEINATEPVDNELTIAVEKNIATDEMKEAIKAISKKMELDEATSKAVAQFKAKNAEYVFDKDLAINVGKKVLELGEEATKVIDNLKALTPLSKKYKVNAKVYEVAVNNLKKGVLKDNIAKLEANSKKIGTMTEDSVIASKYKKVDTPKSTPETNLPIIKETIIVENKELGARKANATKELTSLKEKVDTLRDNIAKEYGLDKVLELIETAKEAVKNELGKDAYIQLLSAEKTVAVYKKLIPLFEGLKKNSSEELIDQLPKFSDYELEHLNNKSSNKNPLAQLGEFFRFTPDNHFSILDTHISNTLADVLYASSKDHNYDAMDWIANPGKRTYIIPAEKVYKIVEKKNIYDTKMNYKTPWLKKLSKEIGIADTRTYGEFIKTFYEPLSDLAMWLKDNHKGEMVQNLGKLMEDATQGASGIPAGTIGEELTKKEIMDYYNNIVRSVQTYKEFEKVTNVETLKPVYDKSKDILTNTTLEKDNREQFEELAKKLSKVYKEKLGDVGAKMYGTIVARMFRDGKLTDLDKKFDYWTADYSFLQVEANLKKAMTAPWIRYPERKMTGLYAAARHLEPEVLKYEPALNKSNYFEYGWPTRMLDNMLNRIKFVEAYDAALKDKTSRLKMSERMKEIEQLRKEWKTNPELEGRYVAYLELMQANTIGKPVTKDNLPF